MDALCNQVLQAVGSGDFAHLAQTCEELELMVHEEGLVMPSPAQLEQLGLIYTTHMLAYLLKGELNLARFLWKRTPSDVMVLPQPQNAHQALCARWKLQYADFFNVLSTSAWDQRLQPLVQEVCGIV
eukprot:1637709-Amphidinium_carterae.2